MTARPTPLPPASGAILPSTAVDDARAFVGMVARLTVPDGDSDDAEALRSLIEMARKIEPRPITLEPPWYPDDDPRWREHTPGDPMPCEPGTIVEVLFLSERKRRHWDRGFHDRAEEFNWGARQARSAGLNVVAWRPA